MKENAPENKGSDLCKSCGLCCNGVVCDIVVISPSQDRTFARRHADRLIVASGSDRGWLALPCPAFDGLCSQYAVRPLDCQVFKCKLLDNVLAGQTTLQSARGIVSAFKRALFKLAASYNKRHPAEPVSPDQVFQVVARLDQAALANDSQATFWRSYPDYLVVCFLLKRYFDKH